MVEKSTPGGKTMYFSEATVNFFHCKKQSSSQVWLTTGIDQDLALVAFVPEMLSSEEFSDQAQKKSAEGY
jgi:hypothetical protein